MKPVIWLVMSVLVLLPALAAVAEDGAAAAPAGHGPGRLMEMMKKADTNNDQQVSFEELKAVVPDLTEEQFKKLDRNGDGTLTKADRPAGQPGAKPLRERLKAADKDGDKKVTKEEFAAAFPEAPESLFTQLDKDKDGVITTGDQAGGSPQGHGPGKPQGISPERLKAADKDGDGKLSKEEFAAAFPKAPEGAFARHDKNGDGYLSKEDRQGQGEKPKPATPPAGDKRKAFAAKMKAADKDGDGNLTLEEFKAAFPKAPEDRFKKMDRNGDGVLNKEDRKK